VLRGLSPTVSKSCGCAAFAVVCDSIGGIAPFLGIEEGRGAGCSLDGEAELDDMAASPIHARRDSRAGRSLPAPAELDYIRMEKG
jgi:hypothetical protein